MDLTVEVYRLTRGLPPEERFGLTAQGRRAATSIPANIAEGHGRRTTGDFLQSLSIARGSLAELQTHLELMVRLDFLDRNGIGTAWQLTVKTGMLINGLVRALEAKRRLVTRRSRTPNPEPRTPPLNIPHA
jgi:four helix bundle protein